VAAAFGRAGAVVDRVPARDLRRRRFIVGVLAHAGAITSFARVWVWIALASWAIVFAATIGRAVEVARGQGPPDAGTPAPTAGSGSRIPVK
jgi:hypothetical protein